MGKYSDWKNRTQASRLQALEKAFLNARIATARANGRELLVGSEANEYRRKQRYLAARKDRLDSEKMSHWLSLSHSELIAHLDSESPNYRKHPLTIAIIDEVDDVKRRELIESYFAHFQKKPSQFAPEISSENAAIWDGYNEWCRNNPE